MFKIWIILNFLHDWAEAFWGLQYFVITLPEWCLTCLISGFEIEKQICSSTEANVTGFTGLHHCRTRQKHCAAAPSVPRDPRPLLHPSSSPPPLTLLFCALTHPQHCYVARPLARSLSVSMRNSRCFVLSFLHSTKPLSHLSLDFWVMLCTLTVKAPLHYPNPEALINLLDICPSSDVTPCIPAVLGRKNGRIWKLLWNHCISEMK